MTEAAADSFGIASLITEAAEAAWSPDRLIA
jgi:hypothetical protein